MRSFQDIKNGNAKTAGHTAQKRIAVYSAHTVQIYSGIIQTVRICSSAKKNRALKPDLKENASILKECDL